MADALAPEGDDPFGSFLTSPSPAPAAPAAPEGPDPFASFIQPPPSEPSAAEAFAHSAERSAIPAIGGLAAAGTGAEAGAALGLLGGPASPVTVPAGAIVGGIAGALLGSTALSTAQDFAIKALPESWQEAIGQSAKQQQAEEEKQPTAAFLGGLLPYALTMRPGGWAKAALPENATAWQKIAANPLTAHLFAGGVMGGMELGNEVAAGQQPNWTNVGISTGFGIIFNKPTRLGESLTELGARPVRKALGLPSPANENAPAAEVKPAVETPPAESPAKDWAETILGGKTPTVAQAGDTKVMGPGITEDVFMGGHAQAPEAEMTAQDAARTEQMALNPVTPEAPTIARRMEPELFNHYDALTAQRDDLAARLAQIGSPADEEIATLSKQRDAIEDKLTAEPQSKILNAQMADAQAQLDEVVARRDNEPESPELAALRQHLAATEAQLHEIAPELAAAHRRADDRINGPETAPEPNAAPAPQAIAPEQPVAEQEAAIVADVTQRLIAAGYSAPQASANAQVLGRRYVTRAARLNGALGSPLELYRAQGPEIRAYGRSPLMPTLQEPNLPVPDVSVKQSAPAAEVAPEQASNAVNPRQTTPASELESIDPATIGVDAQRFQFKAGSDEHGVSERLQDVAQWDPRLAGTALVWRDETGKNWIADGHQRLGLAKRLIEQGQVGIRLNAFVLDSASGITDAKARAIAAVKNISEGTGTAIDAAKIIKAAREDGITDLPPLPPRSALVRDGKALADLSPEAFGMVVNEIIPSNQGAIIARLVKDPAQQAEAARLLAKIQPDNVRQAEMVVRDMLASGTEDGTQQNLFGEEAFANSVVLERAKIADEAIKQLRRDRSTFRTLVDEAERIQGAGANVLDQTANASRLTTDEKAADLLTQLAFRSGPVSDELSRISRRFRSGELTAAGAAREFLGTIREAVERGVDTGADAGGSELGPNGEREGLGPELFQPAPPIDTPAFNNWFGDSKVVDEHGAPLVVYHGGPRGIDAFSDQVPQEAPRRDSGGRYGGIYFSPDKSYAQIYADKGGELYPVYLSIKNPLKVHSADAQARFPDVTAPFITRDEISALKEAGYDGVISSGGHEIVAFDPTQIKSVNNRGTFDPNDPRILYQGGRTADEKNLYAVHNIKAAGVLNADKIGGLPMPSLAIAHIDKGDFGNFGDISLIGSPRLIDPKGGGGAKTYDADVYSPRYPSIKHDVDDKTFNALNKPIVAGVKELGGTEHDGIDLNHIEDRGPNDAIDSTGLKYAYLREQGIPIEIAKKADGTPDWYTNRERVNAALRGDTRAAYEDWATSKLQPLVKRERIFKGFDYNGNRRYREHNIDNVLSDMRARLKEGEGFQYGIGTIRSKHAKQFRSIAAMKEASDRITGTDNMKTEKDAFGDRFFELADEMRPHYKFDAKSFQYADDVASMFGEIAKKGMSALTEGFDDLPKETVDKVRTFLSDLANAPTEYFETKINRGVGLHEFEAALVPTGTAPRVIDALKKHGLQIVEYDKNVPESRTAAIRELDEERQNSAGERILFQSGKPAPWREGEKLGEFDTERGLEGLPQALIPGVKPMTDAERIAAEAAKPLKGGQAPAKAGGLFDVEGREDAAKQMTLFQPAYHGTPHIFDKFDSSKIGSGEGAQAFGHGLYLAGRKEIAEYYRKKLAGAEHPTFDGERVDSLPVMGGQVINDPKVIIGAQDFLEKIPELVNVAGIDQAAFDGTARLITMKVGALRGVLGSLDRSVEPPDQVLAFTRDGYTRRAQEAKTSFEKTEFALKASVADALLRSGKLARTKPGRLLTADIPEDHELLDWEKPLSEQPEGIKEKLKTLGVVPHEKSEWKPYTKEAEKPILIDQHGSEIVNHGDWYSVFGMGSNNRAVHLGDPKTLEKAKALVEDQYAHDRGLRGEQIYKRLALEQGHSTEAERAMVERGQISGTQLGEVVASRRLREAGIPGHRFLDQQSRGVNPAKKYEVAKTPSHLDGTQAEGWQVWDPSGAFPDKTFKTEAEAHAYADQKNAERHPTHNYVIYDDSRINVTALEQSKRGAITFPDGKRPLVKLFRDADASTFIHETGHQWLEELMQDAAHPAANDSLKADSATVRKWLGIKDDIAVPGINRGGITTAQHEKFARGFEQYMREGIAPSPGLARVFAQFKTWLTQIYQSIKGLGSPINEDIRSVFDRLLETEPQRTVIGEGREGVQGITDLHEHEAATVSPHEAEPALDRIIAERDRVIAEQPPEIQNELARATAAFAPPAESGEGAGGSANVVAGGGGPEPQSAGGAGGGERGSQLAGSTQVGAEGNGSESGAGADTGLRSERPGAANDARSHPLAPEPTTLFGPEQSPFLDKAGNIRVENLTTDRDVAQAIHDAADANDDFIGQRRGVVTDGQVLDLADALGMDAAKISKRKIGEAFNAEQVMAARQLLIRSAAEVSVAAKRAAIGTDEDLMAYAQARDRHQMIQGQVAGITAEAGRALRAFRDISGASTKGIDQFVREATGKTLFQLKEEAKLAAALDGPEKVSKFMQDAQKRTFGSMILEYWINGLISGPATHTTYMVGNTILSLEKAGPETAAAALIGRVQRALGRQGPTVRMGEVGAQLKGLASSLPLATKSAIDALRSGMTVRLPGEDHRTLPFQPGTEFAIQPMLDEAVNYANAAPIMFSTVRGILDGIIATGKLVSQGGVKGAPLVGLKFSPLGAIPDVAIRGVTALPLGTVARLPSRGVAAIHSFFRAANYSMSKAAVAYRAASEAGLTGQAFDAKVADILQNPTPAMMEEARGAATQLTLMGKGSEFVQALSRLTNTKVFGFPLFKFIDPFVHIAGNIIDQSIVQRTPIGILSPEIRADLMGKNGNIAQDTAMARMLVGTGLSIAFGSLAAQGLMSGSGPSEPDKAAMWRLAGNQAHSVRIGDVWYDVHRLGPLGMLASVSADMYDIAHAAGKGDMANAGAALIHAFTQTMLDEGFMSGPSELIQALEDPGRYGASYVRNQLSTFLPYSVALGQVDKATDPYSRQAKGIVDGLKAKIPGLSETLNPRRDIWGQPMPNLPAFGGRAFSAILMQQVSQDQVNQALLQLGISPAQVDRKIRGVTLTDQQFDQYATLAGGMAKQRLDVLVKSSQWSTWPPETQQAIVEETIRQSRETARGILMSRFPQIAADAVKARLSLLSSPKP